jgi:hypothetical protein
VFAVVQVLAVVAIVVGVWAIHGWEVGLICAGVALLIVSTVAEFLGIEQVEPEPEPEGESV